MRAFAALGTLLLMLGSSAAGASLPQAASPQTQTAGGVPAAESKFRLLRSVSGTQGTQKNGKYVIQDPRTVFYVPDDHHVIVYVEWEGPLGTHHFEGVWKNPAGKVTAISEFDYEAKQSRFAGYWELLLSESAETGVWTLEARVDGEVTGTHTFQVVAAPRPASAIPPVRTPLTPAELYQRALAASVTLENSRADGERAVASAFYIAPGLVLTAFQVIDGAASLRAVLPDGHAVQVTEIAAWNRRQDWAILKVESAQNPILPAAKPDSWTVGDRCAFLDMAGPGDRIIVDTTIVGKNSFPGAGDRINLDRAPSNPGIGAALLNEYGEAVGVVGGSLIPGIASLEGQRYGYPANILGAASIYHGAMATPIGLIAIPSAGAPNTPLAAMASTGQFLPPLVGRQNVVYGTMTQQLVKENGMLRAKTEKFEFAKRDATATVFLTWTPDEKHKGKKHKGKTNTRVYNIDNQMISESPASKIDLQIGKVIFWSTTLKIAGLPVGIYRVDVLVHGTPMWRTFFRVVE